MEELENVFDYEIEEIEKEHNSNESFKNYRTSIVTTIAFLIGVRLEILEAEGNNYAKDALGKLVGDKKALIIRHLSILRNQFFLNYNEINQKRSNFIPLESMGDLFSVESIKYLRNNEIEVAFVKNNNNPNVTINCAFINQYIADNINDLKVFFPEWVKFEYIKKLFVIPTGAAGQNGQNLSKKEKEIIQQIHSLRQQFLAQKKQYPYSTFIVWPKEFKENDGNILFNDAKFLKLLYEMNNDKFMASSYVIDATNESKESIYEFVDSASNIAAFVDCENADPYKFVATILNLDQENIKKIKKIVLIDGLYTSPAWDHLNSLCDIPIEHKETERVVNSKSLVDIVMTAAICEAYYRDYIESIILVSSDSDFWGVVTSLPNAYFYVLNEKRNTSISVLESMNEKGINHCFMDEFALDKVQEFKEQMLLLLLRDSINSFNENGIWTLPLNVEYLLNKIFQDAQIEIGYEQLEQEKKVFKNKYLKKGLIITPVETERGTMLQMSINK